MIQNAVGRPVRGHNFFDREREQDRLWRRLSTDHVLLLAPRRVGKTSLLLRLADTAELNGFQAVYLSVSDVRSELAFVRRLYEAIGEREAAQAAFKRLAEGALSAVLRRTKQVAFGGVTWVLSEDARDEWQRVGEVLTRALSDLGNRWLLLVDELPLFVLTLIRLDPTGERARHFLNWFRALRQGTEDTDPLRWVLAGSIGLDTVAARLKLGDTINDLNLVTLGAFDEADADRFLEALGHTYDLPLAPEVRARLRHHAGWLIPYYLQLLFSKLRNRCGDTGAPATVDAVDAVHAELLSPSDRAYFDYWRQRLTEELGAPWDEQAIALLNAAAADDHGATRDLLRRVLDQKVPDPTERDARLRFLLDVLQADGYLVEVDGRFPFRSSLLRDFWRKRVAP